jgi:spermidine synthase
MTQVVVSESQGVRYLHLGSKLVQGAMRIARPDSLELEYTRQMMFPLLLRPDAWPRRVLQVGLGSASLTRFLHRHRPGAKLTVVELLPEVVLAARQHFRLPPESERLRIVTGDGADFIARSSSRFDLVIVDGFDGHGQSGILDTQPFFLNVIPRLAARGLAAFNLLTGRWGSEGSVARITSAFDGHAMVLPRCDAGNTVIVASGEPFPKYSPAKMKMAAARVRLQCGLDLAKEAAALASPAAGDGQEDRP